MMVGIGRLLTAKGRCNHIRGRSHPGECPLGLVLGTGGTEERLELGDRTKQPRGQTGADQKIVGQHPPLGDPPLKLAKCLVGHLVASGRAHDPVPGSGRPGRGIDLELVTAVRALDRGSAVGNQGVVELVLGFATLAANIHFRPNEG